MSDGSDISTDPAHLPGQPPQAEPLARDVPCIACGYNLRGLRPEGRCPECGRDIADSLKSELLSFAPPRYLRKLRAGLLVLACAQVAIALTSILRLMYMSLMYLYDHDVRGVGRVETVLDWGLRAYTVTDSWAVAGLLGLVELSGALLLTIRNPDHPNLSARLRHLARWTLALAFVSDLASRLAFRALRRLGIGALDADWAWFALTGATLVTWAAGYFALLLCLEGLARQAARPGAARRLRWCRWTFLAGASTYAAGLTIDGIVLSLGVQFPSVPSMFGERHTLLECLTYLLFLPAAALLAELLLSLRCTLGRLLPNRGAVVQL